MEKILVVDDDRIFLATIKRHLEHLGYEVIENDTGVGVNRQILHFQPLACLIDIVMEKQEGLQTIQEILTLPGRPKIIAVSSTMQYLDWAMALGADAQLLKPVTPDSLAATLNHVLNN